MRGVSVRPLAATRRSLTEVHSVSGVALRLFWVLFGPTVTALRDQITTALTGELATVREAIADGTEAAPTLEIPVRDGTTYLAIRWVIDDMAAAHDAH